MLPVEDLYARPRGRQRRAITLLAVVRERVFVCTNTMREAPRATRNGGDRAMADMQELSTAP
jgi:hypothetical protein